jgi:glycosyltransferase involved in cell wall biosynthesis
MNEAGNIEKLRDVVFQQSVKPALWVICDGNSKDGSYDIARRVFDGYDWIHVISQRSYLEKGYSHKNFALAVNDCYSYARETCARNNIPYSYIGKIDATTALMPDYFEVLMDELESNGNLAFVCGVEHYQIRNTIKISEKFTEKIANSGINDIRLYRRDFFEKMKGYPVSFSPDTVLLVKALNMGLAIKITPRTHYYEPRLGGSKIGTWKGYKFKGKAMFYLNYHPFLVLLNTLDFMRFYPYYTGLATLYGYALCFVRKEEQTDDIEIKDYFWNKRLPEIFRGLFSHRVTAENSPD